MPLREPRTLGLAVRTPEGEVFHGRVRGFRFPGADGQVGVLPRHAPMVAEVACGVVRIRGAEGLVDIAVGEGFADVGPAGATLLVDFCNRPEDVDRGRAHAALQRATSRLEPRSEAIDRARAEAALCRAVARLKACECGCRACDRRP